MDAVIQLVGSCEVLVVEAHGMTEREHCDLAVCGMSCRGAETSAWRPECKILHTFVFWSRKMREFCKEELSILGNLQLLKFFSPLLCPSDVRGREEYNMQCCISF